MCTSMESALSVVEGDVKDCSPAKTLPGNHENAEGRILDNAELSPPSGASSRSESCSCCG